MGCDYYIDEDTDEIVIEVRDYENSKKDCLRKKKFRFDTSDISKLSLEVYGSENPDGVKDR